MNDWASWMPWFLQTVDSQFPNGAYAHSFGLEELVSLGVVQTHEDLLRFFDCELREVLVRQELPYLRYAYEAAVVADVPALIDLDEEVDAWRLTEESRSASTALGGHRLMMLSKLYSSDLLATVVQKQTAGEMPGHQLVVAAVQAAVCQTPLLPTLWAHLYQCLAAYLAAALKLLRVGQERCQRLLTTCLQSGQEILEASLRIKRDEAGCSLAVLDIAASRHATAFSRLFIS